MHPLRFDHSFLNTDPFLMKFLPFESSQSQLSNGKNFIKNGSILRKLWANQIDRIIYKERNNSVTEDGFVVGVSSGILRGWDLRKST